MRTDLVIFALYVVALALGAVVLLGNRKDLIAWAIVALGTAGALGWLV